MNKLSVNVILAIVPLSAAIGAVETVDVTPPEWKCRNGRIYSGNEAIIEFKGEGLRIEARNSLEAPWRRMPGTRVELKKPAWYQIRAVDSSGDERIMNISLLGEALKEEWRKNSVFGLWTVHGDARLVKLAGGNWNRRMTSFREVTREEAAAAKTATAKHAAIDGKNGLHEVGVFSFGMPDWTMKVPEGVKKPSFGNLFYPATNWHDVAMCVKAYAMSHELPREFSIYNEPLSVWKGTHGQLVKYAKAVYYGLKSADPSFRIGGPGLYSIRIDDLSRLADAGLLETLDFIDMHAYVGGTAPEGEFIEKIDALKAFLASRGKELPIVLSEFGWTAEEGTWQPPVSRMVQADYTARSLALAWSRGVEALIYFALDYRTKKRGEAAFSLVDSEQGPMPGYQSFATVAKILGGAIPLAYFNLAPELYMVLGERGNGKERQLVAAVWTTRGNERVKLPIEIAGAFHAYEGELDLHGKNEFDVGQTPVFLICRNDGINCVEEKQLPAKAGGGIAGEYARLAIKDGKLAIARQRIVAPVELVKAELAVAGGERPAIIAEVRSNAKTSHAISITARGETRQAKLKPHEQRQFVFAIDDAVSCVRRQNRVILECEGENPATNNVIWTYVPIVRDGQGKTWGDFSDFWPMGKFDKIPSGADCRAKVALNYGKRGLSIELAIRDDEHCQTKISSDPAMAWSEDSLQLAIDVDVDKPWQAGFAGAGESTTVGGHRVFEWTIAGTGDGKGKAFLARSRDSKLKEGTVREAILSSVERDGDVTRYRIEIPWAELGIAGKSDMPRPGDAIGIALAVNDIDPGRKARRRAVRLFGGVAESKEPRRFGKAFFLK